MAGGDLEALIKAISPKLRLFIHQKTNNLSHTDDILQETLISISQALPVWSQNKPFLNFCLSIAKHEIADFYIKQKIHVVSNKLNFFVNVTVNNLLDKLIIKDIYTYIIHKLPTNYRLVLIYKYEEGLSVKTIAKIMKTTPKAIESILFRARKQGRFLYSQLTQQT